MQNTYISIFAANYGPLKEDSENVSQKNRCSLPQSDSPSAYTHSKPYVDLKSSKKWPKNFLQPAGQSIFSENDPSSSSSYLPSSPPSSSSSSYNHHRNARSASNAHHLMTISSKWPEKSMNPAKSDNKADARLAINQSVYASNSFDCQNSETLRVSFNKDERERERERRVK